jgi:hypothetical protein
VLVEEWIKILKSESFYHKDGSMRNSVKTDENIFGAILARMNIWRRQLWDIYPYNPLFDPKTCFDTLKDEFPKIENKNIKLNKYANVPFSPF